MVDIKQDGAPIEELMKLLPSSDDSFEKKLEKAITLPIIIGGVLVVAAILLPIFIGAALVVIGAALVVAAYNILRVVSDIVTHIVENTSESLRGIVNSVSCLFSNIARSTAFNLLNAGNAFINKDPITNSRLTGFTHLVSVPKDILKSTAFSVGHFLLSGLNLVTLGAFTRIIDKFRDIDDKFRDIEYTGIKIQKLSSNRCKDFMANRFKEEYEKGQNQNNTLDRSSTVETPKTPNRNLVQSVDAVIKTIFKIPTKVVNDVIKGVASLPVNILGVFFGKKQMDHLKKLFSQPAKAFGKIIIDDIFMNILNVISNGVNAFVRLVPGDYKVFDSQKLYNSENNTFIPSVHKDPSVNKDNKGNNHDLKSNNEFNALREVQRSFVEDIHASGQQGGRKSM